jgi:hypothetical protein
MKLLSILSGLVLCAVVATSCAIDASSEATDQPSITEADLATARTAEIQFPERLSDSQITPRACFIEGFCVGTHTEFCIHTGPCAAGEARTLAAAFCRTHCGGDCSQGNILQRANCP